MVGVVTQDAHLFHDTIRANLMYARPGATEEELIEACRAAQIWDLISMLPDGLDTIVGDRGYRLSGGEKQRVALARLLLKAPAVVVLDEATAHLDSESEAAVQQALETALTGRTSLVIAHRLSTIREADQILVIDDGRVRERGQHDELLASGGLYADLYRTQFARQEPVGVGPAWRAFPAASAFRRSWSGSAREAGARAARTAGARAARPWPVQPPVTGASRSSRAGRSSSAACSPMGPQPARLDGECSHSSTSGGASWAARA